MKLVWARTANKDRRAIREYIAADNPEAALALDALISEKAGALIDHPGIERDGRVEGTRELVLHRNYLIVYDIVDETVRVLRVLHAARRWPS